MVVTAPGCDEATRKHRASRAGHGQGVMVDRGFAARRDVARLTFHAASRRNINAGVMVEP